MMSGMEIASATAREMRVEAALARLVVIGRDDEHGVGARLLGMDGELDRLLGAVGAGAGDDRHAAFGDLDAELDDAVMLLVRKRRRFAGRADRNEAARSLADLPVDEGAEGVLVERAVLHGRDQRGYRALEHCCLGPLHFAGR